MIADIVNGTTSSAEAAAIINEVKTVAEAAKALADGALPRAGGSMTGPLEVAVASTSVSAVHAESGTRTTMAASQGALAQTYYAATAGSPSLHTINRGRGTASVPLAVGNADQLYQQRINGWDGTAWRRAMNSTCWMSEAAAPSPTAFGAHWTVSLTQPGTPGPPAEALKLAWSTGLAVFGQVIADANGHLRQRAYTRATLPTPAAANMGQARVTNPEPGKSQLVYCTGTTWIYESDGSAVTIA